MAEALTRSAARNIFYGGSLFFFVIFVGLTAHTHLHMLNHSTNAATLTEQVVRPESTGFEQTNINCHTILGEGAYFAPELGNVWTRYGGREDADTARAGLKAWIRAQPLNVPGRRVMPKFDLSEDELDALISFLQWTDSIDTQNWPPTKAG